MTTTGLHHRRVVLVPFAESLFAGAIGLLAGGVLMLCFGYNPLQAYAGLVRGAFGDSMGLADSLAHATPLVMTGVAFAIGTRAGLMNIGAEGQTYMGAIAAVSLVLIRVPSWLQLPATILVGALAGALWSLPAAILKMVRGVHEVISTIMLNWIAKYAAFLLIATALVDPLAAQKSISLPAPARFPLIVRGTSLSYNVVLSVVIAAAAYIFLWWTTKGFEIRASGLNPQAARYAGMNTTWSGGLAFLLSGLIAGTCGAAQVMSLPPTYALLTGLPHHANLGIDGIAVAMMGRNHPIGIMFSAIAFGSLTSGGQVMQLSAGVPLEIVRVVEGIVIFALCVPELMRFFRRKARMDLASARAL